MFRKRKDRTLPKQKHALYLEVEGDLRSLKKFPKFANSRLLSLQEPLVLPDRPWTPLHQLHPHPEVEFVRLDVQAALAHHIQMVRRRYHFRALAMSGLSWLLPGTFTETYRNRNLCLTHMLTLTTPPFTRTVQAWWKRRLQSVFIPHLLHWRQGLRRVTTLRTCLTCHLRRVERSPEPRPCHNREKFHKRWRHGSTPQAAQRSNWLAWKRHRLSKRDNVKSLLVLQNRRPECEPSVALIASPWPQWNTHTLLVIRKKPTQEKHSKVAGV